MSDWRKMLGESVAAENEARQSKVRAAESSVERQRQNRARAIETMRREVIPGLQEVGAELARHGRTLEVVDRSDPGTSAPEVRAKLSRPDRAPFEIVFKCDPQPDMIRVSIRSSWGEGATNNDVSNGFDGITKTFVINEVVSRYQASLNEG